MKKSSMADKAGRKGGTTSKDTILSDSDGSSDIECETCGISFTNAKSYENHMLGKRHSKKVTEEKLKAKNKISDKISDKEAESENEDSDESSEMHCEICDKHFTGYVSYAAHVKGSVHAKNLKKQKLRRQLDDMPEVIKKENEENDSEDDGIPKPYARCSTCQKEFSGPESFKSHVKSATHLKKVKQAKTLENLKEDEGEHSDGDEIYSKCESCKKSFSGVVPYKIHMQSKVHKKNLEKKKVAEEIKEFCANSDTDAGYVCRECNKTFTDPLAFKCHLKNNSHEKQKAKNALSEFLKSFPEIVYVTPFDKEASEDESGNESDSIDCLICKLCHVSFSGPENAQEHVKSKKHINHKREKQMQKLLKGEQVSPPISDRNSKQTPKQASSDGSHQANGSKNGNENSFDEFELI